MSNGQWRIAHAIVIAAIAFQFGIIGATPNVFQVQPMPNFMR